jgi:hypothetical protein
MPLDVTSPGLDALLLATVLELELSDRDRRVAVKRYQSIPEHLQRPTSPLRSYMGTALIYAQGSRAIGATIVHGADDDRFDLDAILEFRAPLGWSSRKILDELHHAFQGFPDVRHVERCTRCVQLQFAFMHLDVTPMEPAAEPRPERVGQIHHSPDRGVDERFDVNPYGFARWFRSKVERPTIVFEEQVQKMRGDMQVRDRLVLGTAMADADIDELPEPIDPLRDAPQVIALKLMKRYLNLRYAPRDIVRPVSIYLSKVAALVPLNPFGICAQLEALARELERRMTQALEGGRRLEERNPAFPCENFNDRWPKNDTEIEVFRADLRHLLRELERSRHSELSEIQKIFDVLFGEKVSERAVRSYMDGFTSTSKSSTYEHGKGFVATPALLLPSSVKATPASRAPAHHFHHGRLR